MLCADAALPGELGLRGHGRLAAVVPNPGDVLLLSESGWPRCPLIFSHSLFFQTSQRKQKHQEGVVTVSIWHRTRETSHTLVHSTVNAAWTMVGVDVRVACHDPCKPCGARRCLIPQRDTHTHTTHVRADTPLAIAIRGSRQ